MIVLMSKIPGRHYNYREILPGVIAAKSSAPLYTMLEVERGVPEVFNSTYDIRMLLGAIGRLRDGKEIDIPGPAFLRSLLMNKLDKTQIGALLREFGLVTGD